MKEKIKKTQKSSSEIEEEISERIYKKIKEKKLSDSELDGIILKEIENNISFSEDWQKHYAKERIKNRIKEKKYNFLPTTRVRRFLNAILDYFCIDIFGFVFGYIMGTIGWFLGIIISVLYYVIFESIWSKTPAKFITKTKVITEYGEKPDLKTIFIRTLIRFVPFEAFSFLSPERPRGWHDRWSKTIVIDDILTSKKEINPQKLEFHKAEDQGVIPQQAISYCGECGKRVNKHDKFCSKCGAKI